MAKTLVNGYRFDPSTNTVFLPDNIHAEKLLLITNVTANEPIYLFNAPTLGYVTVSFNPNTEETAVILTKDCSAMSASDKLQVFVESPYQEFKPSKEFIDPVQKFRVSNPENLIDTDFEYGLQSTKWETLQTVNNIPTVYSPSGNLPVEGIQAVEAIAGSKQIRVTTNVAHGLILGDPISVQGLTQYQAEGYFTVSGVPDILTFFYELDVQSNVTGDLSGGYTTITPAKFYDGSALPIAIEVGAISDNLQPSSCLVETEETHGFSPGTKVYLRNTIGPKDLVVVDPTVDAPDGRPYVDTTPSFSIDLDADNDNSTGRGTFREAQLISWDWESTYSNYFGTGDFNPATDEISWPNHDLHTRACLLFSAPIQGSNNGGLTDGYVYFVKIVDENTIQLSTNYETLSDTVSLSDVDDTYGPVRLGLVYKVERNNGTVRDTAAFRRGQNSTNYTFNHPSNNATYTHDITSLIGNNTVTGFNIYYGYASLPSWSTVYWYVGNASGANTQIGSTSTGRWSGGVSISPNYNALGFVYTSGGRQYIRGRIYSTQGYWGNAYWQATVSYANPALAAEHSGADLRTASFGLGVEKPDALVAFQGRIPNSYTASGEDFSYLANQRTNGRYSQLPVFYTQTVSDTTGLLTGSFNINYNDPGLEDYGNASQIFYIYARKLDAEKNTIYFPSHGIENSVNGKVVVNATDYANGERFAYSNASGAITQVNDQEFAVEIIPVSNDLVRLQLIASPSTDNIVRFSRRFTVNYILDNDFYNTVFVSNHKIIGSETVVYSHSGYDVDNFVEYDVVDNGTNTAYTFSTTDVNMDGSTLPVGDNPTLTLYRGVTYHFDINATGHPFYIKTAPTTGTGDQYTDGVTGNGTEVGVVLFTVPEDAPATLYYTCEIHSSMQGTIQVQEMSNNIGGLSFGQEYTAARINDSRIKLSATVSDSDTATTAAVGANNVNTVTLNIDIETPLGLNPSSAIISRIEFRGDFGNQNKYLTLTFEDGSNYFVGVSGSTTSVWQTEPTFGTKDITSLLKVVGGKKSFTVTVDPTSQIFRQPFPMTNRWELRFVVSGNTGDLALSAGGVGEQKFSIPTLLGAYDGVYPITEITGSNSFKMQTDFTIPPREYQFSPTDIDNVSNSITFALPHNLLTGETVTYSANGNPSIFDDVIETLHVIAVNETEIKFAESYLSAINNQALNITPTTGLHSLFNSNIIKGLKGSGFISTTSGSTSVTGTGTRFLSTFKRFDRIWIEETGITKEYLVSLITTDTEMELFSPVSSTQVEVDYFYSTQIILRPDGFSLHKPFDGGVDITAGTSPNSKIVRQSRKYFRYQSGKGIQNSFAVNFNPPRLVGQLTGSSLAVATVETQEIHNLNAGDLVVIKDATVNDGQDFYNGEFFVKEVLDPFRFTYDMQGVPLQGKAGGFPTYHRKTWSDAYVRAGMFDDQNGFFFEYDGQKIYCVRRSSTAQIGGTINVVRGSQVITGNKTSFTTQVSPGTKLVIRGQSYLVTEVSSDNRVVVQPAYRGVDARNVKATITVDTRVPQEEWNIDPCDGTGPTGFILNVNKIQMGYADYSWYGAGKIRFGWKDQNGEVKYVHEFKHNNRLDESYFRSGNLPGRYEIENGPNANHAPTLFHFGTSVIMDGTFDDDKAYLFTANSKPFAFTNGANFTVTSNAISSYQLVTLNGRRVWVYAIPVAQADAEKMTTGTLIRDPSNTRLPDGTYVTQVKLAGASSLIYTSYPAISTEPGPPSFTDIPSGTVITAGETTAIDLTRPLPLISIRLAPSVDSSLTGAVGEREIINRMQLQLRQAGVTANQDILVFLILNALPSSLHFDKVQQPSLSELIEHNAGETLLYGTTIYSLKASSGSTEIDLGELLEMGNSILGGDNIFPAGPDLLTVAVQPQNTAGISGSAPFFVSGKISWSESQA
jgi:hypothetical protein